MSRAGAIFIAAMLCIAAAPTPIPLQPRPAQPIDRNTSGTGTGASTPAPAATLPKPQSHVTNQHSREPKEQRDNWVELFKTVVELLSVAITAIFTLALALWTKSLRDETRKLALGADEQSKKMAESIAATYGVAERTGKVAEAMEAAAVAMDNVGSQTQKVATAAASSAATAERALKDLERPFVFADISNVQAGMGQRVAFPGDPIAHETFRFRSVELSFANFGRTPALLRNVEYAFEPAQREHGIAPIIDPHKVIGRQLPVGVIATMGSPFTETENLNFRFDEPTLVDFAEGRKSLWLVGFVRYDDIFSQHHISGFCMVFDMAGHRFVRRGGEKYNYSRIEYPYEIPKG